MSLNFENQGTAIAMIGNGKKSKIKHANGCKKTSLCACKHVKCMVKPRRCAGITKCSRGKKYSK